MCDRTQEFLGLVQQNGGAAVGARSQLGKPLASSGAEKNAFHESATTIARGVHKTANLLVKLTALVRKQGLFDDPTDEINALIYRIKHDLDDLNSQCDQTEKRHIDSQSKSFFSTSSTSQVSQHNAKVVSSLKSELMTATKDFKGVLELRSHKMKDQQQRKVELTGKGQLSALNSMDLQRIMHSQATGTSSSLSASAASSSSSSTGAKSFLQNNQSSQLSNELVRRHRIPLPSPYAQSSNKSRSLDHSMLSASASADEEDLYPSHSSAEQQQLLLEPINVSSQYYDSREQAVTEVEKTIGELGSLFKRLATMLHEQQALVERIDEDVENATHNTQNAKDQLIKALESASSNRGMMMKIGGILAIFFLFFVLFLM